MIFFAVKRKITISYQLREMTFLPPPAKSNNISSYPNRIYCCTSAELIGIGRILESMSQKDNLIIIPESIIKTRSDYPLQLGASNDGEWERNLHYSNLLPTIDDKLLNIKKSDLNAQISKLNNKHVRIAIMNGTGTGIGDTIIGLTAFSHAYDLISKYFKPSFDIIFSPNQHEKLHQIFEHTNMINDFHISPISLKQLCTFDAIFDTGGIGNRSEYFKIPVIDLFLTLFGINPDNIDNNKKRNNVTLPSRTDSKNEYIQSIRNNNPEKKLILLHPKTSTTKKSIPDMQTEKIINYLVNSDKYIVLTDEVIDVHKHLPIIDLSEHANSFNDLCLVISQMDGIFTADTCVYHIADYYDIPTVAWFMFYDPNIWAKYYPKVKGILLTGAKESGYLNHKKNTIADTDLKNIHKIWGQLNIKQSLRDLEHLMSI